MQGYCPGNGFPFLQSDVPIAAPCLAIPPPGQTQDFTHVFLQSSIVVYVPVGFFTQSPFELQLYLVWAGPGFEEHCGLSTLSL